jgi:hypothetical protein
MRMQGLIAHEGPQSLFRGANWTCKPVLQALFLFYLFAGIAMSARGGKSVDLFRDFSNAGFLRKWNRLPARLKGLFLLFFIRNPIFPLA